MATVYILYSNQAQRYYVGSCKNLKTRIEQHHNKEFPSSYTPKYSDWTTFFVIDDLDYQQARKIELHIKKMKSKIYIENLLAYPQITEKLKLKFH